MEIHTRVNKLFQKINSFRFFEKKLKMNTTHLNQFLIIYNLLYIRVSQITPSPKPILAKTEALGLFRQVKSEDIQQSFKI